MKDDQIPHRNRGRPLAFDPDQALDAAMRVFWLKGYEGASVSDLTGAMGINKPSLYARFNDKRGLFLAALERYNATVGAPTLQKVVDGKTVHETIIGYLSATNAFLTSPDTPPGCLVGSVVTDMAGRDDEIRAHIAALFASTEAFLTQRFKELGDAPMDEATLAELIVSFGQSLAARARVGATLDDLSARTDRFLSVVLRAEVSCCRFCGRQLKLP
ncbi:MAG: TetR/AcrR family transcriptional regulator [Pseudomonadota bacterium]